MSYWTDYSTQPQEKVKEIAQFLRVQQMLWREKRPSYVSRKIISNSHELWDYISLEIDWINWAEYSNLELYDDDEVIDDNGTTVLERLTTLDKEIEELDKMDKQILQKFAERL